MGMGTLQRKDLPFERCVSYNRNQNRLAPLLAGFGGKDVGAVDYGACTLCPRACGGGPEDGSAGILPDAWADAGGQSHAPFLGGARTGGAGGVGAIFFSGCTLGCLYCQNEEISAGGLGREWTSRDLRRAMEDLIAQGAENIDLVTPTHFLPEILRL